MGQGGCRGGCCEKLLELSTAVAKAEPISDGGGSGSCVREKAGSKAQTDLNKKEKNILSRYINFCLTLKSSILNLPVYSMLIFFTLLLSRHVD